VHTANTYKEPVVHTANTNAEGRRHRIRLPTPEKIPLKGRPMTKLRRLTSLLAVLAMMMTVTAVPAFAIASATATVVLPSDLLSGQGGQVIVRIANTAAAGTLGLGSGSGINAFVIEVPQHLVTVAAADVALPDGWDGGYDAEIGFIFASTETNNLAPGDALNVTIGGTAKLVADDTVGRFVTSVSDNGGLTLSEAGAPKVTSRILKIIDTVLVKPTGVANQNAQQVTADQTTSSFKVQVKNFGSAARSVTADVVKKADSGTSTLTSTTPATTPATADDTALLATGATTILTVPATFGAAGSLTVSGKATSTNSAAAVVDAPAITVQAKFVATLVANSLQPKAVTQGASVSLLYAINKTAGVQPVTGSATFEFGGFSTTAAQSFDAANGNKQVSFPNTTVPNFANGEYATASTITGTDANGANVSLTLNPGTLTLDNLLPIVNITANPGASDIVGAEAATTNGRQITFTGTIGLNAGTENCTNCTISNSKLIALPSGTAFSINLTNTSGNITGSATIAAWPADTTSTYATATAVRPSGSSGTGVSLNVPVDLIAPKLVDPGVTFRDVDADKIIINLADDGVLVDTTPSQTIDWSVDNNTVTAVTGLPSAGAAVQVVLTLQTRLDDNATPTVSYAARPLLTSRMHDRVSLEMADQSINTIDGIMPVAPLIETVSGLGLQDDEFWTNQSAPTVTLSALVPGNTLEIFFDTNNDGIADEGDVADGGERVFAAPVETARQTVQLSGLGNVEVGHKLIARMKDNAGNLGNLDVDILNLDFTAALIISYAVSGQNVTVTFNEPVARGRNAAFDWTVTGTADGRTASRTVTSVAAGSTTTTRVLTVSTSSWDGSSTGASVGGVRYKFRGTKPAERYEDRATNKLLDVAFTS
jgi:hypothetical protein